MRAIMIATPFLLLLYLTGCSSAQQPAPPGYLLPTAQTPAINPHPVTLHLASYLDRGGIVLQLSDSELHVARQHRWAEPLGKQLERALQANLPGSENRGTIIVTLSRFQGVQNGDGADLAVISGRWKLSTHEDTPAKQGLIQWQAPLKGNGYANLVRALDQGWKGVAKQITDALDGEQGFEGHPGTSLPCAGDSAC